MFVHTFLDILGKSNHGMNSEWGKEEVSVCTLIQERKERSPHPTFLCIMDQRAYYPTHANH